MTADPRLRALVAQLDQAHMFACDIASNGIEPEKMGEIGRAIRTAREALCALPVPPASEWLDTREFYEVMQAYRWADQGDHSRPAEAVAAFEAVKAFIRSNLPVPPEEPKHKAAQYDQIQILPQDVLRPNETLVEGVRRLLSRLRCVL